MPAYLKDMFGTRYVGAIHGLLMTAWSMAGIFGPVLVNYIRKYNIAHGVPKAQAYNVTMYIMAGLLFVGFFCNLPHQGCKFPASTCSRRTKAALCRRPRRPEPKGPRNSPARPLNAQGTDDT